MMAISMMAASILRGLITQSPLVVRDVLRMMVDGQLGALALKQGAHKREAVQYTWLSCHRRGPEAPGSSVWN